MSESKQARASTLGTVSKSQLLVRHQYIYVSVFCSMVVTVGDSLRQTLWASNLAILASIDSYLTTVYVLCFTGTLFCGNRQKLFYEFFGGFYFRGQVCVFLWALFPDVLNLIFAVFNFANGHRLAKYMKLNPPRNIRRIRYLNMLCRCGKNQLPFPTPCTTFYSGILLSYL